jgi:hypothetical protein
MANALRKAVVQQDSQHNLAAAIEDHRAVVAQFDSTAVRELDDEMYMLRLSAWHATTRGPGF